VSFPEQAPQDVQELMAVYCEEIKDLRSKLEKSQNLLISSVKWIDRIVGRRDDLPVNFFDNCNPSHLAKEIRAALEEIEK
jgi:hypothetical protein